MPDIGTVREQDLDEKGNVRRKYELREETVSRSGPFSALGLILANVFLVVKQVFFSSVPDASAAQRNDNQADMQGVANDAVSRPALIVIDGDKAYEPVIDNPFEPTAARLDSSGASLGAGSATNGLGGVSGNNLTSNSGPAPLSMPAQLIDARAFGPQGATSGRSGGGGSGSPIRASANDNTGDLGSDPDVGDTMDDEPSTPGTDGEPGGDATPNRLPVVGLPVTLRKSYVNQSIIIAATALLAGAEDADGDELTVENITASSGTVAALSDGTWQYTPAHDEPGDVVFEYDISDSIGTVRQVAHLNVAPVPGAVFPGTPEPDHIVGTLGPDRIDAGDGDDIIIARDGDDFIVAGDGDDRIVGNSGDDTIYAGAGDDVVFAGGGNDVVFGGSGDDFISGGTGHDSLLGEEGNDRILGDDGDDSIFGGDGNDSLEGGAGSDLIDGGTGIDLISGGSGNDIVIAGDDNDVSHGDDGDDIFIASTLDGDDVYDGGTGTDTYDASVAREAVEVDLEQQQATGADIGSDQISNIENVVTGAGDDVIVGDDNANRLNSGAGNDTVIAGGGADTFVAMVADGNDVYYGDAADSSTVTQNDPDSTGDTYDASATTADAQINLQMEHAQSDDVGTDVVRNVENVVGGSGSDTITGSDDANDLRGSGGNDTLVGQGGNDRVAGDDGDDVFVATHDDGDDAYDGGDGDDTYDLSETTAAAVVTLEDQRATSDQIGQDTLKDTEHVVGSAGDDTITGNEEDNTLRGSSGDDRVEGRGGNDTFVCSLFDGDDQYDGGDGSDTYSAVCATEQVQINLRAGYANGHEIGHDELEDIENAIGGSGNDTITGTAAVNVLSGGAGHDIFVFPEINEHGGRDRIEDFEVGDRIDVSDIDGDRDSDGFQRMTFLFDQAEFDGVGQAIFVHETREDGVFTVVQFNIEMDDDDDDDERPEYEIEIVGRYTLEIDNLIA